MKGAIEIVLIDLDIDRVANPFVERFVKNNVFLLYITTLATLYLITIILIKEI